MSLTSYRAAPPRAMSVSVWFAAVLGALLGGVIEIVEGVPFPVWSGGDLLSHVLRRSTIGATALNGRVRDGIGCFARAMATSPGKRPGTVVSGP